MTELCTCQTTIDHSACQCSVGSSDCLDVTGSGSSLNPFSIEALFDPDPDNLLSCATGLLVALPSYISSPPRCSAYHNANQSLTDGEETVVDLNSEYYDTDTMHSTSTNNSRITFTTSGVYVVTFVCAFAANATGDRRGLIRRNGSETLGGVEKKACSASFSTGICVTVQEYFSADEYVEATVKQDSGGALNLVATRYSPILSVLFRRRTIT